MLLRIAKQRLVVAVVPSSGVAWFSCRNMNEREGGKLQYQGETREETTRQDKTRQEIQSGLLGALAGWLAGSLVMVRRMQFVYPCVSCSLLCMVVCALCPCCMRSPV